MGLTSLAAGAANDVSEVERAACNRVLAGEVIQVTPTLKCLGIRWFIGGDENRNACAAVSYRPVGSSDWKAALDLFRVETAAVREPNRPPPGHTLLAGSIFDLSENTEYEVRLSLRAPDGGDAERLMRMKTWAEPRLASDAPRTHQQHEDARDGRHAGTLLALVQHLRAEGPEGQRRCIDLVLSFPCANSTPTSVKARWISRSKRTSAKGSPSDCRKEAWLQPKRRGKERSGW